MFSCRCDWFSYIFDDFEVCTLYFKGFGANPKSALNELTFRRLFITGIFVYLFQDRKVIVKSFKGVIPKISCDRHGRRVLLTMFDTIDDTVLLSKVMSFHCIIHFQINKVYKHVWISLYEFIQAICSEMMSNLNQLVMSDFGKRTIVYLLAHRTPLFFDPEIVKQLERGDSNEFT